MVVEIFGIQLNVNVINVLPLQLDAVPDKHGILLHVVVIKLVELLQVDVNWVSFLILTYAIVSAPIKLSVLKVLL